MKKIWVGIAIFSLAAGVGACASGNSGQQAVAISNTAVAGANATGLPLCSSGSYNPTGMSVYGCQPGSFESVCQQMGGLIQSNSGAQVCRIVFQYGGLRFSSSTPLARLNSSDSMNSPEDSGIRVFRGDVVSVSNVRGGWSASSSEGCGVYAVASSSGGYDTELMMSEGLGVYPVTSIGTNSGAIMIGGNGDLVFGLNIPDSVSSGCDSLSIGTLQLQRCLDASNNSYPCQ